MDPDFWHERWRQNLIGFHQGEINPHLKAYWPRLRLYSGDPVFVPLCGKTRDMIWLREQRHPVLGVELSPIAVGDFFKENALQAVPRQEGPFTVHEADELTLFCGDFFDLQPGQLASVRGVYDRASLIALPPAMRPRFVARLREILPAPLPMLLITLEYGQEQMGGPPFSVEEQEVRALYEADWSVQLLCTEDVLASEAKFRDRGLSHLYEKVYLLEGRS